MPSPEMHEVLDELRARQREAAVRPAPSLAEVRATFLPIGRPHPIPDDVTVTAVTAAGVPAHWLDAPGVDPDSVLLFLHGGGFRFGSLASDGELASRLGRAAGMRVLFPEYRLTPEHPFPAAVPELAAQPRDTAQARSALAAAKRIVEEQDVFATPRAGRARPQVIPNDRNRL